MSKSENFIIVKVEKADNMKRLSRIEEYVKEKTTERLNMKDKKLEDLKNQKIQFVKKKKLVGNDLNKKKEEYMHKFESIFNKKSLDVFILF